MTFLSKAKSAKGSFASKQESAFGQIFLLCLTDGRAEVQNYGLVRLKAEPNCSIVRKSLGSALGSAPEHFFGKIRTPD